MAHTALAAGASASPFAPPEQLLFSNGSIRLGTFRCPVRHPEFRAGGQVHGYTVAFPRTAVWIEPTDAAPFVADPGVVAVHNRGCFFTRRALAPDGDRTDWFSVSRDLAIELAIDAGLDPDPDRPFGLWFTRSGAALYYRQRRLLSAVRHGLLDAFDIEHEVIGVIGEVLQAGAHPDRRNRRSARRDRPAIREAQAELARDPCRETTLRDLARTVGLSPFHLCRTFHRATGLTLREYRLELRLRLALEQLEHDHGAPAALSRIAHSLRFSSHSHFSSAFRRRVGLAPSRARRELTATSREPHTPAA